MSVIFGFSASGLMRMVPGEEPTSRAGRFLIFISNGLVIIGRIAPLCSKLRISVGKNSSPHALGKAENYHEPGIGLSGFFSSFSHQTTHPHGILFIDALYTRLSA